MKKSRFKKVTKGIMIAILGLIVAGSILLGWRMYQIKKMQIVSIADVQEINFSTAKMKPSTQVSGQLKVNDHETVSEVDKTIYDGVLYLFFNKMPAVRQQTHFAFKLGDSFTSGEIATIEKVIIVAGDVHSDTGTARGYSATDLQDLREQKLVWQAD